MTFKSKSTHKVLQLCAVCSCSVSDCGRDELLASPLWAALCVPILVALNAKSTCDPSSLPTRPNLHPSIYRIHPACADHIISVNIHSSEAFINLKVYRRHLGLENSFIDANAAMGALELEEASGRFIPGPLNCKNAKKLNKTFPLCSLCIFTKKHFGQHFHTAVGVCVCKEAAG